MYSHKYSIYSIPIGQMQEFTHMYSISIGHKQEHVPEQLFDIVSGLGTGLNEHHIKFFGLNTRIYM
jgi:hypothetical protein